MNEVVSFKLFFYKIGFIKTSYYFIKERLGFFFFWKSYKRLFTAVSLLIIDNFRGIFYIEDLLKMVRNYNFVSFPAVLKWNLCQTGFIYCNYETLNSF